MVPTAHRVQVAPAGGSALLPWTGMVLVAPPRGLTTAREGAPAVAQDDVPAQFSIGCVAGPPEVELLPRIGDQSSLVVHGKHPPSQLAAVALSDGGEGSSG